MDNLKLKAKILERLKEHGRLPFSEFMQMALYEPEEGYYTNRQNLIGARGDFYTAPHLTPIFGQLLAKQFAEMWERLGKPSEFTLMEMGAGQGLLASDVLGWFYANRPDIWITLRYIIIEISQPLIEAQSKRLNAVPHGNILLEKVSWCRLDAIDNYTLTGCIFSNEFFDALPVDLFTFVQGQIREIYVCADEEGNFIEEVGDLRHKNRETPFFEKDEITLHQYPDGYRTEICSEAISKLHKMQLKLERGYILTIDYGYLAESRYHPRRTGGTLQCYFNHQTHSNPYINVGKQDITAHVDFSLLKRLGGVWGLPTLGYTNQMFFLGGLGIAEIIQEVSSSAYSQKTGKSAKEILVEHNALQTLINPNGMGDFKVLIQGRNIENQPPLSGLQFLLRS